jgi:hypothetical protein
MWRYQPAADAYGNDTWACNTRCFAQTHWRVHPDFVEHIPIQVPSPHPHGTGANPRASLSVGTVLSVYTAAAPVQEWPESWGGREQLFAEVRRRREAREQRDDLDPDAGSRATAGTQDDCTLM